MDVETVETLAQQLRPHLISAFLAGRMVERAYWTQTPVHYDATRRDGEVWEGASGKWFTKENGHVHPAPAPGGGESLSKPEKSPKTAPEPDETGDVGPSDDEIDDLDAGVDADLAEIPELQSNPAAMGRVRRAAQSAIDAGQWLLWEITLRTPQILGGWTDIFEGPDDLNKIGYTPGFSGVSGHQTPDALRGAIGISSHQAAGLVCKFGGKLIAWAKRKIKGQTPEEQHAEFEKWAREKYGDAGLDEARQWVGDTTAQTHNIEFWNQNRQYAGDGGEMSVMLQSAAMLKSLMGTIGEPLGVEPNPITVEQLAANMMRLKSQRAGANPVNNARTAYVTDAVGHEHANDGKFTSGGGGAAKSTEQYMGSNAGLPPGYTIIATTARKIGGHPVLPDVPELPPGAES